MALQTQFRLKQTQELKLTQQMRQSLELIQWGHQELLAHLHQEEEENPLVTVKHNDQGSIDPSYESSTGNLSKIRLQNQNDHKADNVPDFGREKYTKNFYQSSSDAGHVIEATKAFEPSIYDRLQEQIRLNFKDAKDRAIANFWLQELDEYGRLKQHIFLKARKLNPSVAQLEKLLFKLQLLEPAGLFARNLQECLRAQLIDLEEWDHIWEKMFSASNWQKLHDLTALSKTLTIDLQIVKQRLLRLTKLNSNPFKEETQETPRQIVPELIAKKNELGEWTMELNSDAFPEIIIQSIDTKRIDSLNKENIDWLKAKNLRGKFLEQALIERANSILKVGKAILQRQVAFFEYGQDHLTTMTMQEIGEKLDMHESTISRLVRDKYIITPQKIIEMRWFFQSGGQAGNDLSPTAIQSKIQQLIDQEPRDKPYSDEVIAAKLKQKGIDIARRTIAKYRENANILSASKRKKHYKITL